MRNIDVDHEIFIVFLFFFVCGEILMLNITYLYFAFSCMRGIFMNMFYVWGNIYVAHEISCTLRRPFINLLFDITLRKI